MIARKKFSPRHVRYKAARFKADRASAACTVFLYKTAADHYNNK